MKLKIVERDYNLLEVFNFLLFVAGWGLSDKIHPRWVIALAAVLFFFVLNYKLTSSHTPTESEVKRHKALYYSVSFWWLLALAGYFVYGLLHTGWVFWFLFLAGMVGAGVATVKRLQRAQPS